MIDFSLVTARFHFISHTKSLEKKYDVLTLNISG